MSRFDKLNTLTQELLSAIASRDAILMADLYDELTNVFMDTLDPADLSFECMKAYCESTIACLKFKAYNNMNGSAIEEGKTIIDSINANLSYVDYTKEQNDELRQYKAQIKSITDPLKPHRNLVVPREDCRCTLCRIRPANKTGSHMVPNFLAHPTFSWDGKGKRDHEAMNHDFMNRMSRNCQYYGSAVPEWRFAQGEGKTEVTEEDIEKNINQLEYDNEFCKVCEDRFGILETVYAKFYNGQARRISPRVAYLFWLSVLWRMSMGSMSIFMEMHDELALRRLLNDYILESEKAIEESDADLGVWKYAMFRAEGLVEYGDKGIFGYRKECSPYVAMYNDLVMVFYHDDPSDSELVIGPITVKREDLNDWKSDEKCVKVDRRWFTDVRDWICETSYDFYDPVREDVLINIREKERSTDTVISDYKKEKVIKAARLKRPPKERMLRLHKFYRIFIAWFKLEEAQKKGEKYVPLDDEYLFLKESDFQKYYEDLANLSKHGSVENISEFPFYAEAKAYIPEESRWIQEDDDAPADQEYVEAVDEALMKLKPKQLLHLVDGTPEPYKNPYRNIGRNDPCPCGSGKKFKKCCGKEL